ncbi:gamma-aminobutyric acid receptor subunit pi-like isoform X4 [Meleagris gallopavo]|uniref:gamma-aminobutyric acid receptor subunit pi-like isoform X4 n=1 Tax=Meleagris gallopavo TaxID=9103 RepID=UPI000549DF52|nr:gamma-aminobutyric acid receptor subunit pi-like isoform X4 [Meleagris gallopavo]
MCSLKCCSLRAFFLLVLCRSVQISDAEGKGEILPPTIQNIIKGYNKYLRPFFDNGPVSVGMSLDIASIDTISEINMDYTATIFLRQRWTDERLCFDGNKSLSLDGRLVEMLWVPDTFIVDSKKSFLHDITVENRLIRIYPNGTVLYAIRITTTVACSMDLTKYPMDKQTCTLQLESWGYNINDVMFYWTRGNDSVRGLDTLQLAQYTVEDHFTSVSEAVYETGRYPKLVFHFELKRNILYFILETYVPSILLVVLSWVSFWISQSSVPARICIVSSLEHCWSMLWLISAPCIDPVQRKFRRMKMKGLKKKGMEFWQQLLTVAVLLTTRKKLIQTRAAKPASMAKRREISTVGVARQCP